MFISDGSTIKVREGAVASLIYDLLESYATDKQRLAWAVRAWMEGSYGDFWYWIRESLPQEHLPLAKKANMIGWAIRTLPDVEFILERNAHHRAELSGILYDRLVSVIPSNIATDIVNLYVLGRDRRLEALIVSDLYLEHDAFVREAIQEMNEFVANKDSEKEGE